MNISRQIKLVNRKEQIRLQHTGRVGPSAYEVALLEGFVGTEAEWLASLKGQKGDTGDDGHGLPEDGTAGQVLRKSSSVDYDYDWADANDLADKNYVQDFNVTNTVTVNHNLNKYPAVTVLDSAGDNVVGEVKHLSINSLKLTFSAAFSGRVTCN